MLKIQGGKLLAQPSDQEFFRGSVQMILHFGNRTPEDPTSEGFTPEDPNSEGLTPEDQTHETH